jgi:hypothetical protein
LIPIGKTKSDGLWLSLRDSAGQERERIVQFMVDVAKVSLKTGFEELKVSQEYIYLAKVSLITIAHDCLLFVRWEIV